MDGVLSVTTDFDVALTELYRAFGAPRPTDISGCPCCIDTKEICKLTSKALRDLTERELASYSASVFLTVDGKDFRYFLPRIFELSATVGGWWPSPEVVIGKLRRANWEDWTGEQKDSVRKFLAAWLERYFSLGADGAPEVDSILCGIGLSGDALAPYLEQIARHPETLQAYADLNAETFVSNGTLANPFWEEAPERGAPIVQLLGRMN